MSKNDSSHKKKFFFDDNSFIEWIVNSVPELNDKTVSFKKIIKNIKPEEPILSQTQREDIWNGIQQTITSDNKKKIIRTIGWRVAAVAAVFIFIITALLHTISNDNKEIDYNSILTENEDVMRSEKISLILSDSSKIDIDKDSSKVTYDVKGNVMIDSESVGSKRKEYSKNTLNQLIVPYGKTSFLTLSDGTKVWVNSGSRIVYPSVFNGKKREIFVSGEVFLDVKKADGQPFVIKTDQLQVKVLGTQLNVSTYKNEPVQSVVLVTGAVSVSHTDGKETHTISPGEKFSYDKSSHGIDIKNVDVSEYTSWINGYILLRNESLDNILRKLERHYSTSITYENKEKLRSISVSGKLDLKDKIEDVLNNISIAAPIHYQIHENTIIIK